MADPPGKKKDLKQLHLELLKHVHELSPEARELVIALPHATKVERQPSETELERLRSELETAGSVKGANVVGQNEGSEHVAELREHKKAREDAEADVRRLKAELAMAEKRVEGLGRELQAAKEAGLEAVNEARKAAEDEVAHLKATAAADIEAQGQARKMAEAEVKRLREELRVISAAEKQGEAETGNPAQKEEVPKAAETEAERLKAKLVAENSSTPKVAGKAPASMVVIDQSPKGAPSGPRALALRKDKPAVGTPGLARSEEKATPQRLPRNVEFPSPLGRPQEARKRGGPEPDPLSGLIEHLKKRTKTEGATAHSTPVCGNCHRKGMPTCNGRQRCQHCYGVTCSYNACKEGEGCRTNGCTRVHPGQEEDEYGRRRSVKGRGLRQGGARVEQ